MTEETCVCQIDGGQCQNNAVTGDDYCSLCLNDRHAHHNN